MAMGLNSEEPPKVSIIVINFRSVQQLDKCLTRLMRTSYPNYEVIVVDCLTENIDEWFKNSFPEIKLLHYDHDIGASASHNVGKKFLDPKSKYIVFLDNDAYVTERWLAELVKAMESDEKIGAAQAKIVLAENPEIMDHAGIAIDALGTWYTLRGLKSDTITNVSELFASSSAGCIVRRDLFEKVDGFDPDYFIYDDDTDFSFRVRLLGYSIILVPSSVVLHEGVPERFLSPKKLYHSVKNRICTMLKNYELKNLLWRLYLYLTLTFLAGVVLSLIGRIVESREIFKSLFYPLLNMRGIMMKRMRVQSMRKIRDSILINKGLIRNDIRATLQDIKLKSSLVRSRR